LPPPPSQCGLFSSRMPKAAALTSQLGGSRAAVLLARPSVRVTVAHRQIEDRAPPDEVTVPARSWMRQGLAHGWRMQERVPSVYRAVPSRRLARQACMRVLSGGWRAIVPEPSEPVTKLGSIRCQCASSAMRRASGQQAAAPAPEWALAAHPGALVPAERCRREWNGACSHHDSARVSRAAGLVWLSAGRIFVCHADGGQRRAGAQPQRTLSGKQAAAVPVGMPTSVTVRFAALLMCTAL